MNNQKISVYANDENGDMHLIERGIPENQALRLANEHYYRTGEPAFLTCTEEDKVES